MLRRSLRHAGKEKAGRRISHHLTKRPGKTAGAAAGVVEPVDAGPSEMTFALVTCSGVSNTGKLTTQAAFYPAQAEAGDRTSWMHARQSAASLEAEIEGAEQVIVIDGVCGRLRQEETLPRPGSAPDLHIVATELGIEKNGMGEVGYDEIEKVVRAVMNNGN